jgi:serine/threonine-protein kinase HipA
MSRPCSVCLEDSHDASGYHPKCLRRLFGTPRLPVIDIELAKLHTAGLAMVGHTSLSGIQKKISLSLSADRATLQVAVAGGRYILKPQTNTYPALPENEHLTTRLAALVGIETGPNGIIPLKDGSPAFVVARFDRLRDGHKLRMEDFCQLAEKSPKEKYDASAELCARLVRQFASEHGVEILKLYRQFVFAWWIGNGDLHLKNLSLLADQDGRFAISPAYDLVCTRLVIKDDPLALTVCGKKERLVRTDWLRFAEYEHCGLPRRAAQRVLDDHANVLEPALSLVDRSMLPTEMKKAYRSLLEERTKSLS